MVLVSFENSTNRNASPNQGEANDVAEHYIPGSRSNLAVLNGPQCLILKCRERRVCADEPNGNQITPIRARGSPAKQGQDQSNEKRAAHVDDERSVREPYSKPAADVVAKQVTRDCPRESADADGRIFKQT